MLSGTDTTQAANPTPVPGPDIAFGPNETSLNEMMEHDRANAIVRNNDTQGTLGAGTSAITLSVSDGVANVATIQALIAASAEGGLTIELPVGTYPLMYSAGVPYIYYSKNLKIVGAGRGLTVLDVYPKTVTTFNFYCLKTDIKDITTNLLDFDVLGPTDSLTAFNAGSGTGFESGFLLYRMTIGQYGTLNHLYLTNLTIKNTFTSIVQATSGDGVIIAKDCSFTAGCVGISDFDDSHKFFDKHLWVDNCTFSCGYTAAQCFDAKAHGAGVYVHPHISLKVANSRFITCTNVAVQHYSGRTSKGVAPKYCLFNSCSFENSFLNIVTTGEDLTTAISNCSFIGGHCQIRNDTNVTGCAFNSSALSSTAEHRQPIINVNIANTDFVLGNAIAGETCIAAADRWHMTITNCSFRVRAVATGSVVCIETAGISPPAPLSTFNSTTISNCQFVDLSTSDGASHSNGIRFGQFDTYDTLTVDNCEFRGRLLYPVWINQARPEKVRINNCQFRTEFDELAYNRIGIHVNFTSTFSNASCISGSNNYFEAGSGFSSGATVLVEQQNMQIREALNPKTVESAATIYLDCSYSTHRVSGTTQIDNINLGIKPYSCNTLFASPIKIIVVAGSSLATSAAGNIIPKIIAQRAVNAVLQFIYVQTSSASKWIEI